MSVWNVLDDDGNLLRIALAVPSVDLHKIIVEALQLGDVDVARRVRLAFVEAATGQIWLEGPTQQLVLSVAQEHDVLASDGNQPDRHRKKQPFLPSRSPPFDKLYVEIARCWAKSQTQRRRGCVQCGRQRPEKKE